MSLLSRFLRGLLSLVIDIIVIPIGIVLYILTPIIAFDGTMAMLGASMAAVVGIIFIVLYGVNLKHMSN